METTKMETGETVCLSIGNQVRQSADGFEPHFSFRLAKLGDIASVLHFGIPCGCVTVHNGDLDKAAGLWLDSYETELCGRLDPRA